MFACTCKLKPWFSGGSFVVIDLSGEEPYATVDASD